MCVVLHVNSHELLSVKAIRRYEADEIDTTLSTTVFFKYFRRSIFWFRSPGQLTVLTNNKIFFSPQTKMHSCCMMQKHF